ncbi:MAG: carboxypeptidase-like regulatory domain-containing protein, partial [bacterium]
MKQVMLMLAFACLKLHAGAQHVITGTVSDTENNPLTGANVILIENQKGAVTDKEGNFRFTSPPGDYTIQVSFVGYETFPQEL